MALRSSCLHLTMVLVTIQTLLTTVHMQSGCSVRYISEPGASSDSCNIIGAGANITCYVKGTSSFNIQWYYTADPLLAGVLNDSTAYNTQNPVYSIVASFQASNDYTIRREHFIISKLDASSVGYYWCGVKDQPAPSQVVHIEQQCNISTIGSCAGDVLLSQASTDRCADASNQSVSIVNAQDLQCEVTTGPPPETTDPTSTGQTTSDSQTTPATTTVEDKQLPSTTVVDRSTTETTVDEEKPTTSIRMQPGTVLTPTTQESKEMSTSATSPTTTDDGGGGAPQSEGGLPTDVIWLAIGVVLTLLLVAVFVLLTVIATLQWKKRKIKGVSSPASDVRAYTESSRDIPIESVTGKYDSKKAELDLDPVYAEIPSAVPANLLRLGVPNPFFTSSGASREDVPLSPFLSDSGQYEDLSDSTQPRPVSRERITSTDVPGSGRSSQIRPSTSSIPHSPLPVISDIVFDDPKYEIIDSPVLKKRSKVHVTLSMPHDNSRPENDENNDFQNLSEFVSKSKLGRKFSLESHAYTPVIPTEQRGDNNYTFAIVSTEEKYISEQGHLYHVLESSMKSDEREESTTPRQPVSPVSGPPIICAATNDFEPVYHVLEDSSNSR